MSALAELKKRLEDINALHTAVNIMDWDQNTFMPRGGAEARGAHVGILTRMAHVAFTDEATQNLLGFAKREAQPGTQDAAIVRVVQRDMDQATKLPSKFVEEKSRLATEAHEVWVDARAESDFEKFRPYLERQVEFARQEAEYLGYEDHIYDALLDKYEEGAKASDVRSMFEAIKAPLVELVKAIQASGNPADDSILKGEWDEGKQRAFTEKLVQAIGFDFHRGRQDTAPHPFCTNFSVNDVRLTTRFKKSIAAAIFGSLHEAGHGMYEQGSPTEWDRTPLAGGISLGVHESQSRTWENIVGRSRPFWEHFYPSLQETFSEFKSVPLDKFVRAVNKVQPSLIRVEADEATYNLHILIRFELECDLLTGALAVKDLPGAWNQKYSAYLGVTPPNDAEGCLQDVHWSGGMIGYFPTYSMGNLLSYQIWNALRRDLGDTDAMMRSGNFKPILGWLQEKIYRHGKRYTPTELVTRVTGKPMGAEDYLAGLTAKYSELYGLGVATPA